MSILPLGFPRCGACTLVGSRATCIPIKPTSDHDYLVLIAQRDLDLAHKSLLLDGWDNDDGGSGTEAHFNSWKKRDLNVILTHDKQWFDKFILATHVAKSLNIQDKQHRIILFQAILYGNKYLGQSATPEPDLVWPDFE